MASLILAGVAARRRRLTLDPQARSLRLLPRWMPALHAAIAGLLAPRRGPPRGATPSGIDDRTDR